MRAMALLLTIGIYMAWGIEGLAGVVIAFYAWQLAYRIKYGFWMR